MKRFGFVCGQCGEWDADERAIICRSSSESALAGRQSRPFGARSSARGVSALNAGAGAGADVGVASSLFVVCFVLVMAVLKENFEARDEARGRQQECAYYR